MDASSEGLPDQVTIEFTTPGGLPISLGDLGEEFLERHGLTGREDESCRFRVQRMRSAAGNEYFKREIDRARFPDGFSTRVVVEGVPLRPGVVRESKKGNLVRSDSGEVILAGIPYLAKLTIVQNRKPYWISFVAHRKPNARRRSASP